MEFWEIGLSIYGISAILCFIVAYLSHVGRYGEYRSDKEPIAVILQVCLFPVINTLGVFVIFNEGFDHIPNGFRLQKPLLIQTIYFLPVLLLLSLFYI